jgi:hypothetical protein
MGTRILGIPTIVTPPHNFICQRQDGIGEIKEEEGRPMDPSQETKRKRKKEDQKILAKKPKEREAKTKHLKTKCTKIGRPEEENFVKKQVSHSIQFAYPLSNQYEAHVLFRQAIAAANCTRASSFASSRQAIAAADFTSAASVTSARQAIAAVISACNAAVHTLISVVEDSSGC